MSVRPQHEVAEIFRLHAPTYLETHAASREQRAAVGAIMKCRTAALGGHLERCDRCGHERNAYNSCRNRHCPKCQSLPRFLWLCKRKSELLAVEYFHVVFTVPPTIAGVALQNQRVVYGILFRAVGSTLRKVAANPRHLGARIGHISVLHTWGQNLLYHPHIHCVVPGGGLSMDGRSWIPTREKFLLSVRVLSRCFRGAFLAALRRAFAAGKLVFTGRLAHLANAATFSSWLGMHYKTDWVVYSKRPFAGPEQVLEYLGRYTHRVAISNQRLLHVAEDGVSFRWKDYHHGDVYKTMTLQPHEFIRRFLLHVLPSGFVRIRHGGIFGNRCRRENLAICRELTGTPLRENISSTVSSSPLHAVPTPPDWKQLYLQLVGHPVDQCPLCHEGKMRAIEVLASADFAWPPQLLQRPPPRACHS